MVNEISKQRCENCSWRKYAERKPDTILARLWKWHTGWCPGWKKYQKALAAQSRTSSPA